VTEPQWTYTYEPVTEPPDLTGATIIHTHPGNTLTFIIQKHLTLDQAETLLHRLQTSIPGAHIVIADGIHQVIAEERPTLAGQVLPARHRRAGMRPVGPAR
jgi:hypothetical protein